MPTINYKFQHFTNLKISSEAFSLGVCSPLDKYFLTSSNPAICFSYKRSPKEIDCPKEYWFLQQGVLTCTTTPPQEHLVGTTYFLEGKTVEDICKLFSAKVVYCDQYGYYCYSYKLQKKVEVCGKVVNLQISADGTKVGFPLIVGSY